LAWTFRRFYTDPDYFLEYFLRYKIFKFKAFPDDTPLTPENSGLLRVTHEAGILGQKVLFLPARNRNSPRNRS